jgi:predicted Zn-dependent protease
LFLVIIKKRIQSAAPLIQATEKAFPLIQNNIAMRKKSIALVLSVFSYALLFYGCGSSKPGGGVSLFTLEQDKELGLQVKKEIESNPSEFPILPEASNREAYKIINDMTREILNSGNVVHRNTFAWEVKIIKDDNTLNAFCTPGGYIYVYTGLIKFLDKEDELAGVMGHEIAHADQRHSTRQMSKMYGLSVLLSALAGNQEQLAQITAGLIGLKFSRSHETEADKYSVHYLSNTHFNCAGAAGFFEKMQGHPTPPQFLSTHPNPSNRVEKIKEEARGKGCKMTNSTDQNRYQKLKSLL